MLKKLALVCFAIMCLAIVYHFGATSANSQAGGTIIAIATQDSRMLVMTPSGDVYSRQFAFNSWDAHFDAHPAVYMGNFWEGSTSTQQQSWGEVKAKYK